MWNGGPSNSSTWPEPTAKLPGAPFFASQIPLSPGHKPCLQAERTVTYRSSVEDVLFGIRCTEVSTSCSQVWACLLHLGVPLVTFHDVLRSRGPSSVPTSPWQGYFSPWVSMTSSCPHGLPECPPCSLLIGDKWLACTHSMHSTNISHAPS